MLTDLCVWCSNIKTGFVMAAFSIVTLGLSSSGCGPSESRPVDIESGDVCSSCGMVISQLRLASEIIFNSKVYKFDDLGCLSRYKTKHSQTIHGTAYVTDFATKQWIRFDAATIVPTDLQTPMGSGLVAFADSSRANSFARAHPAKVAM